MISLHGKINIQDFLEVLSNQVRPMVRETFLEGNVIFLGNSAPIHTTRIVKEFHEEHSNVEHLVGPSQYPNLNIIENLWSVLELQVGSHSHPHRRFDQRMW